jgi:predicted RNA-binding Zn-ribbon protein involved in translation (DUF1610 family)
MREDLMDYYRMGAADGYLRGTLEADMARSQLIRKIGPGDYQCVTCGATGLRLEDAYCPQCGRPTTVEGEPPYSDKTNTGQISTAIHEQGTGGRGETLIRYFAPAGWEKFFYEGLGDE